MSDLSHLYQEIILDHNKRPRHYGILLNSTHSAEGVNSLCGDRIEVFLQIEAECIRAIQFEAACCAICKASASMMASSLTGLSISAAAKQCGLVSDLLSADESMDLELSEAGEIVALSGVREFPARIKCAMLPWQTYQLALQQAVLPK
jgi:nitrogen fixation protein NifU and related proteins